MFRILGRGRPFVVVACVLLRYYCCHAYWHCVSNEILWHHFEVFGNDERCAALGANLYHMNSMLRLIRMHRTFRVVRDDDVRDEICVG